MKVFYSFKELEFDKNTVLTVGTFDGVHRGHQAILSTLLDIARSTNSRDLVMTIHPHPQQVLQKEGREPVKLLTTLEERLFLFEKYGINNVLVIPFDYKFSQTEPEIFVREYLVKQSGVKTILIGYDHLFGRNRGGDKELLQRLGAEQDFNVIRVNPFEERNLIISSTKIRQAIKSKEFALASELLGYDYFASGEVIVGDKRGRLIGYPTANISIDNEIKLLPPNGVYLVKVEFENQTHYGMSNIGIRPTFEGNRLTFETNIFDFNDDIYGKTIKITFIEFIREEKKFSSVKNLKSQLNDDTNYCLNRITQLIK